MGLVPRRYWSPIHHDLPADVWTRRSPMRGIAFGVAAQVRLFEELAGLADDWAPPPSRGMYGAMDAVALHGMLRHLRPTRVVELGSGVSTGIINGALGRPHEVFDPYPNDRTDVAVRPLAVTDVPLDVFTGLAAGDVLFVDTSHAVRTGGDVPHCPRRAPRPRPGLVVHLQHIFLPFDYPRAWVAEKRLYLDGAVPRAGLPERQRRVGGPAPARRVLDPPPARRRPAPLAGAAGTPPGVGGSRLRQGPRWTLSRCFAVD